ncbi:trans-1,2-dihydrobenzene-1,2-diol dehydrogenase isoform X2 [Camponotus floridanus]|uniref:trans-1,2-dihydrobenzene-1,2-diol dehydrogenase isoform X2 n=1 Tax=Camponotus floridanus TaxID=104421 RepID=UPI00059C1A5D|nr:trans-1,2-dihydrobenzene-1,2-diol dehydrogenase isoform X2 [Camponotus floridanus]
MSKRYLFYQDNKSNYTLRWGIAGITRKLRDFISALEHTSKDEHMIIAIAAQNVEDLTNTYHIPKVYNNYEQLALDTEIDIVFIGTINSQHFDTAMLMLKHGKHVLCESPMTLKWENTSDLIDYAQSKQLFLMEAMASRFFPAYDFIRQEIESRNIGDVDSMDILETHEFPIQVNELILDSIFHCLQFVCLVYNNELPTIIIGDKGIQDGNIKSIMIRVCYQRNRIANILVRNSVQQGLDPSEARIFGTHGIIKVPQFTYPIRVEVSNRPTPMEFLILPNSNIDPNFFGFSYVYEITEIYTCILNGYTESPKMTHDTSLVLAGLKDIICKQLDIWYS